MANIHLTLAMGNSDIVRDFTSGEVRAEGIDITYLNVGAPEVFNRFLKHREFDVAELSFGMYTSLASQNDQSIVSIPVFPWRNGSKGDAVMIASIAPLSSISLSGRSVTLLSFNPLGSASFTVSFRPTSSTPP